MFQKVVVIDCRAHMLGRLASVIAKELLAGQHIVCVRTEELNISGSQFRNGLKFKQYLRIHTNTNPARGPFHHRAPSRILFRAVRGMIPHKSERGQQAMARFKAFEGVPAPYDTVKRVVVPDALRVMRLKPKRDFANVGELASAYGWKHLDLIKRLEAKRKVRSQAFYTTKKAAAALRAKAAATA